MSRLLIVVLTTVLVLVGAAVTSFGQQGDEEVTCWVDVISDYAPTSTVAGSAAAPAGRDTSQQAIDEARARAEDDSARAAGVAEGRREPRNGEVGSPQEPDPQGSRTVPAWERRLAAQEARVAAMRAEYLGRAERKSSDPQAAVETWGVEDPDGAVALFFVVALPGDNGWVVTEEHVEVPLEFCDSP